jgi:hypothetical protein
MATISSDRFVHTFRLLSIAILLAGMACYVLFTLHWQWMWDTQVMHYIVLLLDHGKVPYRDILDINMPGSYLTERWAIDIFGGTDLGWRLYEFTLLGALTLAMIVIAWPYDWLAGLFAGAMFTLQLGSLGPWQAAERDEVMTVLIFVGYACLFLAVRRRLPALMLPFGLAMGVATLIKPTVLPLILFLLVLLFVVLRRRATPPAQYLLFALAGLAIALAILLNFLLPQHAFGPFFRILSRLVPYYSTLAHPTLWVLIRRSLPQAFRLYLPLALLLAITAERPATWESNWELWAIRAGILFGAVSYFIQRKGYDYHRIALVCFGLLWVGLEFTAAIKDRNWRRYAALVGMAFAVLVVAPQNIRKTRAQHETNAAAFVLMEDLNRLGGNALQNRVQCLDMVGGCFSALYRLGLVQNTGFMGDTQFFGPDDGKVVPFYRKVLLGDLRSNPPSVIILSNEWYQESTYSFEKLNTWPEFRDYLNAAYRLDATQGPFVLYGYPMTYRIYLLKQAFPGPGPL